MIPAWAQRQAELLSDCIVSPDVFQLGLSRLNHRLPGREAHPEVV